MATIKSHDDPSRELAIAAIDMLAELRSALGETTLRGRIARVLYQPTQAERRCAAAIVAALAELGREIEAERIKKPAASRDVFDEVHHAKNLAAGATSCGMQIEVPAAGARMVHWSPDWQTVTCNLCKVHEP